MTTLDTPMERILTEAFRAVIGRCPVRDGDTPPPISPLRKDMK